MEPSKSPVGFKALGILLLSDIFWQEVEIFSENHIYTVTFQLEILVVYADPFLFFVWGGHRVHKDCQPPKLSRPIKHDS